MKKGLSALAFVALVGCGSGSGDSIQRITANGDTDKSQTDPGSLTLTGALASENSTAALGQCSAESIKSSVLASMQDYYLFYDQLPNVTASDFATPEEYIRALRVTPFDRFSYVTDKATSDALFEEGQRFGFGMRLKRTEDQKVYLTLVEPLSPLGQTDATRGDEVLAINGTSPDGFTSEFINSAFGEPDEEKRITLTLQDRDSGNTKSISVSKAQYAVQSVLDTKVVSHNNHRIGYLNFLSFLETSKLELTNAFQSFKSADIDELILDLRFNSGGRVSVAEQIGSSIAGDAVDNATFTRFVHNDKYSANDFSVPFTKRAESLNLTRVYVLTSPDSCSASEMVINSLEPFIDVVTIGGTTCGKPYATRSNEYCGKSINALEIDLVNASSVGGYFQGISADCPVTENVSQALGQSGENLFNAALHHLDTGICKTNFGTFAYADQNTASNLAWLRNQTAGNQPQKIRYTAPPIYEEGPHFLNPEYDEIRPLLR